MDSGNKGLHSSNAEEGHCVVLSSLCLSPPGGADWYHQTQPEMKLGKDLLQMDLYSIQE